METLICVVPEGTVVDLSSGTCPGAWQLLDGDPMYTLVFIGFAFVVSLLGALVGRIW